MRHEKKTHALELAQLQQQQQQQNLSNTASTGPVVSGATTVSTTSTQGCSTNQASTQHNSSPKNIASNNMQSTVLTARKTTCSSPSSTSSSLSPPALLPTAASSSPSTNATYSLQNNACTSPNPLSHSSPSHQFQVHEQFQAKMNLLAMSPPAPPNPSSPCQIMETSAPSNQISTIATDYSTHQYGLIDVKPFHANKRFRHVSSPSTLQQIHPTSANIHLFNPNTIQNSLRTNAALFPNIIVVENSSGNGISYSGGNNGNRVLIRKADDPDEAIDINTLLAQPSMAPTTRDAMMISPKPEPTDTDDFFQICRETVSENDVLEGVRGMVQSQEQPSTGEMILSQIKEEREDRSIQDENFTMENEFMSQQPPHHDIVTRIQEAPNEAIGDSMLLDPSLALDQQQGLIKNEFILKKEDIEEAMDDIIDDQPSNEPLATQLQESVRLKSEDDPNGDIDWLLTEMMSDSKEETSTTNIIIPQQVSVSSSVSSSIAPSSESSSSLKSSPGMVNYLSSSVPLGNTVVFGGSRFMNGNPGASISVKNHPMAMGQQSVSQFSSQPKVGSLDNSTLLYEDQNTPAGLGGNAFGQRSNGYSNNPQKKLLGDLFTGTKNPVLPSIYTDSTLIVPEPKASKYHSPHQSLQMFESDFMDIDSFLKGGSDLISTPGDGKDIPESIFNM